MAFAHLSNGLPFFKINGQYSALYPVPVTSLENFNLPQDLAPSNYLVNQSLNFEIDITKFSVAPEIVAKTKYNWDFGDGAQVHGLAATHTYTKIGSYILSIYADDGQTPKPQLFESVLINILPTMDYQLPKAVIKVNGQEVKNPLVDVLKFAFNGKLKFDGTSSSANSSRIVYYFWDFGDRQSSGSEVATHSFDKVLDRGQIFPVLRVKDANGFIADAYAEIDNQNFLQSGTMTNTKNGAGVSTNPKKVNPPSQFKYTLEVIVTLLGLAYFARMLVRRLKIRKLHK